MTSPAPSIPSIADLMDIVASLASESAATRAELAALRESIERHHRPEPSIVLDDIISLKAAVRLTGRSESTIRRWCDRHAIGWRTKTGSRVVSRRLLIDLAASRAGD